MGEYPALEAVLAEVAGMASEDAAVAADQQRVRQHAVAIAEFAREVALLRVVDEDRIAHRVFGEEGLRGSRRIARDADHLQAARAAEAIALARQKVEAENRVRDEIRAGSSAVEVYRKYGVL